MTGDVKLKLYKGNMINAGVTSPFTLYDEQTASFGEDEDYNQADATRLHQPVRPVHQGARKTVQELAEDRGQALIHRDHTKATFSPVCFLHFHNGVPKPA